MSAQEQVLVLNGAAYHVRRWGAGPPLLLLHGFTGAAQNWAHIAAALAAHHTVIAPDLLGHGASAAPAEAHRYALERAADDLAALLAVSGAAPADVLGYSMGGRLALGLAALHPSSVRRLVLESASPGLDTSAEREARAVSDDALADRIEREGVAAFVDSWEQLPLFASQMRLPAHVRHTLRQQRLANRAAGLAGSLRGMGTGRQPSFWPALADLRCPTLLLTGADDAKFCAIADAMAAKMPAAHHVTIPNAGHTTHLEQPDAFLHAVADFLTPEGMTSA